MRKNWKLATMALVAGMTLFTTSCSDDDPAENTGIGGDTDDAYVPVSLFVRKFGLQVFYDKISTCGTVSQRTKMFLQQDVVSYSI